MQRSSTMLTGMPYGCTRRSVAMRMRLVRLALGAAGLLWLAGCQTASLPDPLGLASSEPAPKVEKPAPVTPELLGTDPNDDLSVAKKYFRQGSYGLAERHFRRS